MIGTPPSAKTPPLLGFASALNTLLFLCLLLTKIAASTNITKTAGAIAAYAIFTLADLPLPGMIFAVVPLPVRAGVEDVGNGTTANMLTIETYVEIGDAVAIGEKKGVVLELVSDLESDSIVPLSSSFVEDVVEVDIVVGLGDIAAPSPMSLGLFVRIGTIAEADVVSESDIVRGAG